jgi:uncharacterized repeat protein (TIGR01451 family)
MNRFLNAVKHAPKRFVALVAVLLAVIIPAVLANAWGPASRPTYTMENPADYVTFNSITNNPVYGDERNFVRIKEAGADNSTFSNSINLVPGREYTIWAFYHNNANPTLNSAAENQRGIARNARIRAEIPSVVPQGSTGTAGNVFLSADNANPGQVWDTIRMSNGSDGDIAVRFVQGSATLTNFANNNPSDQTQRTFNLPDAIVGPSGTLLGFNQMDGNLPGCNEYSGFVMFNIKAVQPNFELNKQVRIPGSGAAGWSNSVTVNPGDKVEYLLTYRNTGSVIQENVVVSDILPAGVTFVPGSTRLSTTTASNQEVQDGITTTGLNIGNFAPGSTAHVWFTAQIGTAEELGCGTIRLVNTGRVDTPNGATTDTAEVIVELEECVTPPVDPEIPVEPPVEPETPVKPEVPAELPQTGPVSAFMAVTAAGSVGTAAAYYVSSRRRIV